ncbi:transmembrane protein 117 isoform X1 [Paramormyrops kingsleyae]|uniref:Transmembrane protein 117 n=2 Tax=Paramormyrops kingsleyae TaxID=1676925 RepID=A0A3B3QLR5_9TELE|nr:transmembrane protein 117 isoform X1 [Paramormyrops kingsleyae]XP_023647210.1 transmembrane protein 117 isoform X1 [Paramormyrops kingsleyae]XP_023647211.1 transmembrane protein 117 isoform X1 [Paramormyrops kingsleyae]XP_023647212.1 transmembrane protein 117 isoform X1 [Paramormyrops kingsleyae]
MDIDARFRYYFQHPWARLSVASLVTFFNFLIFAEDPVSHSHTQAHMTMVGNCFSFIVNKYPGGGWNIVKVLLWLVAIVVGLFVGKFFFHKRIFGQYLRLKMFREDHGSWMTMFFSTILFLFIFSHVYNLLLFMAGDMGPYMVTDHMGIRNELFMKMAAVGTWMGDFVTAWMVNDMMLQDKHYPDWARRPRRFWKQGHNRIVLFWAVLVSLTSVVVLVISTDWISWDNLNRGFLPSDEVSRAFLASFILVFDLLIVMQDWAFPHFMGDLDINLPGLHTNHVKVRLPVCKRIFKEEYHIHITGKWFNYGIIFMVLILDLNMWKNQIFYEPYEYGQYVGPGEKIYTVEVPETLVNFNRSTLTWEWRSSNIDPETNLTYVQQDMFLHSRYIGASLDIKCLAFIPSLAAFALFGFFISLLGRFQDSEQGPENRDKSYERIRRKSPSEHSKEMGGTPEETCVPIGSAMKRSSLMLLSVDTPRCVSTSSNSMCPCSPEVTHPNIIIDCVSTEEPAVSFDPGQSSP